MWREVGLGMIPLLALPIGIMTIFLITGTATLLASAALAPPDHPSPIHTPVFRKKGGAPDLTRLPPTHA